jgi:hypothetical protein
MADTAFDALRKFDSYLDVTGASEPPGVVDPVDPPETRETIAGQPPPLTLPVIV